MHHTGSLATAAAAAVLLDHSQNLQTCVYLFHMCCWNHCLFAVFRHSLATRVAASAREGGGSGRYGSSSGGSGGSNSQGSDSRAKARSRHYYESTPRYKSRRADPDAAVSDAVADALSASFGDLRPTSSSSSSGRTGKNSSRGRSRGVSTADSYIDDLEEERDEGRGWWEVPREQRWGSQGASTATAADPADLQLEPWQEQQLLLAAASSKKKMQVGGVDWQAVFPKTRLIPSLIVLTSPQLHVSIDYCLSKDATEEC